MYEKLKGLISKLPTHKKLMDEAIDLTDQLLNNPITREKFISTRSFHKSSNWYDYWKTTYSEKLLEVVKGKDLNQQKLNLRKLLLTATDQFIDKQYLIYSGELTEEKTNRIITDVFKQDMDTWYEMSINLIVIAQADIHASRSIANAFYDDCSDKDFYHFYSFIREQYANNLYRGNLEMLDNGGTSTIYRVLFNETQKMLEEITPEILKGKDYYYDHSDVDEDKELAEA